MTIGTVICEKKAFIPELYQTLIVPVMAAVAVREKVVSIGYFSLFTANLLIC